MHDLPNRRFYPTRGQMCSRIGSGAEGDRLLAILNARALEPQTFETVAIREGVICNNQVDHYSTRFTDAALGQIVELFAGTNNHIAHDSGMFTSIGGMPVGIGLEARVEPIEGVSGGLQVRAWWANSLGDETGDHIQAMVARGFWSELSLAWWMESYTCDIDGKNVCQHWECCDPDCSDYYPGQKLNDGRIVIGIMDQVVDLVEFSYVPRGGQIGTSIDRKAPERVENLVLAARGRAEHRTERTPHPWGWLVSDPSAATPQGGATR